MLRVRGESMINVGIMDGDLILVQQQNTAHNGEIVVAMIDGLKRSYGQDLLSRGRSYSAPTGKRCHESDHRPGCQNSRPRQRRLPLFQLIRPSGKTQGMFLVRIHCKSSICGFDFTRIDHLYKVMRKIRSMSSEDRAWPDFFYSSEKSEQPESR